MIDSALILDALGDGNRRAIMHILANGATSVQALADQLPISRPAVSRHLRLLKEASLVDVAEDGAKRVYRVREEGVAAAAEYTRTLWERASERFTLAAENLK